MTKTCKKILLTVFLALCFVLCFGALAACGDDDANDPNGTDDDAVTYTVTVLKDDETPASGVKVTIRKGSSRFPGKTTDANGKAEFELSPDNYTVELDKNTLPEQYGVADGANLSLTKDSRSLTVTLAKKFAYTVNLVDTIGNPYYAEGVTVGVCTLNGTCKTPVALGSNGVAVIEEVANDYHVKVEGLPADKAIPCNSENYYTEMDFSATETEMTITVYSLTEVSAFTPMTNDEKAAYASQNNSYAADNVLTAYHVQKTLAAGQTAYFSFTPQFDGQYRIYKDTAASYLYNGTAFQVGNNGKGIYSYLPDVLQKGKSYRFNVSNLGSVAINADFVIETPAASNTQISGQFASQITTTATIVKEGANAIIELSPTVGVALKLTAQGATKASILCFNASSFAENAVHSDYTAGAVCTAKFTQDQVGGALYFSVAVDDAANYPVELQVKIERTNVLTNTINTVSVTENLSTYAKPDNTALKSAEVTAESELVKNAENGYYYANNRLVLVKINELAYKDKSNPYVKYVLDVTPEADKNDLAAGKTFSDYRMFIRGFLNYTEIKDSHGIVLSREIPGNITAEKYYAKFANADGAYPLTEELLTFVKALYANNTSYLSGSWTDELYCYKSATLSDDPIVGDYAQFSLSGNTTLTVNADGTFEIESMGKETGVWEKNPDGTYTFTNPDPNFGDVYTVTRDELGILNFVGEFTSYSFKTDVIVNNYVVVSIGGTDTLAVKCDGTYTFTENNHPATGTWVKNANGTYTFTDDDEDWGSIYTVTRNNTGVLAFVDENDETAYEFKVYVDPVVNENPGYETADKTTRLTVRDDGTCSLFATNYSYAYDGTWSNKDNSYSFTIISGNDDDPITTVYTATFNKYTHTLTLTEQGAADPAYVFTAVNEEE